MSYDKNETLSSSTTKIINNSLSTTTEFISSPSALETGELSSTQVSSSSLTTITKNNSLASTSYVRSKSLIDNEYSSSSIVVIPGDEESSYLTKLKQSISDLLTICDSALDKIPPISTTIDEIKSTEVVVSRDPSTTKVYNEAELRYLVDHGPYQPVLSQYPINESLKKINDTCRFVPKWYKEFPLIEYSPLSDAVFCFCCRLFGQGPGGNQSEDAWISTGVKSWNKIKGSQGAGKKGKIYVHNSSTVHKSSFQRYLIFKQRKNNVDNMLDKNLQHQQQQKIQEKKSNEEIIEILIDCIRFLARQALPLRGHVDNDGNFHQLVYLLSKHNPVLEQWIKNNNNRPYKITYMSKDSQNEFIQLLADDVQQKNLSDIRKARYYSVIADASLDSNRQDMLSIFIRFVNEHGAPEERFVSIKQPSSFIFLGDAIANHILEVLNELELDTTKLIAQSYDCANNMCGEFNGVQAKISEKLKRNVRLSVLDDTTSSNLFALTPKTTISIRWNAKYQSIRSIYESIDEILEALNMITDDHITFDQESRQQANSIIINIKTFNFFTYLVFMKNLMCMTNSITTQLQAEKLDLITAGELLTQTIKLLETERSNEINLNNLVLISEKMTKKYGIDPESEFSRKHRKRKPPKRLDDNPQTTYQFTRIEYYRTIFRQVFDQLITEYKQVLTSIDSNVRSLTKISPKYITSFTEKDAKNICEMLQIHDADLFYNEVQLYKTEIFECNTIFAANEFIHDRKLYIPLLCQAYEYLLTMPVTVASVERSFSKMKIVKNRLRTQMNDERLNSLLLCTLETSILDELSNNELAKKWVKNKAGRRI
ncbi:unnamed protein product [Rotaria sordida]|nr:unnamed protein product [Rotaria sordida]